MNYYIFCVIIFINYNISLIFNMLLLILIIFNINEIIRYIIHKRK